MRNLVHLNAEQRKHRNLRAAVPPRMLALLRRNDPGLLTHDEQEELSAVRVPMYSVVQNPDAVVLPGTLDGGGTVLAHGIVAFNYPENV